MSLPRYYTLLGLKNQEPTEEELKKAYKKSALKHHPDRNPGSKKKAAEAKFKEISEAYAVLSDPRQKQIYDAYGEEGLKGGPPPPSSQQRGGPGGGGMPEGFPEGFSFGGMPGGGGGFQDGNGQTFVFMSNGGGGGGGDNPFAGMRMGGMGGGGMSGGTGNIDPHDLFRSLFGDIGMMGGNDLFGEEMDGSPFGGLEGSMSGGRGLKRSASKKRAPPKVVEHTLYCTLDELYLGTRKRIKVTRTRLDTSQDSKVLEIVVQPGWKKGTKITFPQEGDEMSDGTQQDIVFKIDEKPHGWFQRQGDDLYYKLHLSPSQAKKGVQVKVPTLDGRELKIQTGANLDSGKKITKQGEGMPKRKIGTAGGSKGDMVLEVRVAPAA